VQLCSKLSVCTALERRSVPTAGCWTRLRGR
jgi:hypothetical protein